MLHTSIKSFLPIEIHPNDESFFSNLEFKSFYFKLLNQHLKIINTLAERKPSGALERLLAIPFEKELEKIDAVLHQQWQKSQPFAHLTTAEIIKLIQEEIPPVKRGYHHLQKNSSSNVAAQSVGAEWVVSKKGALLADVKTSLQRLTQLEQNLKNELLFRCQLAADLEKPSHFDDVVVYFCKKLKAKNFLDSTFKFNESSSAQLNDDRRLLIHDLLKAEIDQEILHQHVIGTIASKSVTKPLRTAEEIKVSLKETYHFCREVLSDLNLTSMGDFLFNLRVKSDFLKRIRLPKFRLPRSFKEGWENFKAGWEKSKDIVEKLLKNWRWDSLLKTLWKLRFLSYLFLSLYIQSAVAKSIKPLFVLIFSKATFLQFSSILFYSIGLAPVWYVGWQLAKKLAIQIQKVLTQRKMEEILSALMQIENAERFLASQLSSSIVDVAHFDIKQLAENSESMIKTLRTCVQQLGKYQNKVEAWLSQGAVQTNVKKTLARLERQLGRVKEQLRLLAEHIALRIGEQLGLLIRGLQATNLAPVLSQEQILMLQDFVSQYGGNDLLQKFLENTNVINRWIEQVENYSSSNAVDKSGAVFGGSFNIPWGRHAIRHRYADSWHAILSAFIHDKQLRKTCLKLNDFLQGKCHLTQDECTKILNDLKLPDDKKQELLSKIQALVFDTLAERSPELAAWLPADKKDLIREWYKQYESKIAESKGRYVAIFSQSTTEQAEILAELEDDQLRDYHDLLTGADLHYYVCGHQGQTEIQQLAQKFFLENEGKASQAFCLIIYIPEYLQKQIVPQYAKKRLGWLLDEFVKAENSSVNYQFSEVDRYLFIHPALAFAKANFDFEKIILEHANFKKDPPEKKERFLRACKSSYLIDKRFVKAYQQKSSKITNGREYIVTRSMQLKRKLSKQQQKLLNLNANEDRAYRARIE